MKYKDGEPCEHKGCLNHVTHPCEGCGRVAGQDKIEWSDESMEDCDTEGNDGKDTL